MLTDAEIAARYARIRPYLDERQRRLWLGVEAEALIQVRTDPGIPGSYLRVSQHPFDIPQTTTGLFGQHQVVAAQALRPAQSPGLQPPQVRHGSRSKPLTMPVTPMKETSRSRSAVPTGGSGCSTSVTRSPSWLSGYQHWAPSGS